MRGTFECGHPQQRTHNVKERSQMGVPICIQSTLSCLLSFPQVPQPLHACRLPLPSAHLGLKAFSQSKPNITSHLLIVTSIYFSEFLFLHSLRIGLCPHSPKSLSHPVTCWLTFALDPLADITQHRV